ncbi:MAG: succinate--CoA ligase subunit beta [Candidatus Tectomicrobia bacterium RIFCSPLOWO2_12_FULL_69_37]|nr:MAG: succinate--CoA ligase subunit beta [Candidatus Tectomicrobia bacterium RIFCSPLOWO2_02_FULL_70_19]OGL64531.1 MAG: succinate--CoA ligase subunit beta [Candidatus Tectomicrobia bacterium RIFCSPLOWO2_12_FULL_69_37]
MNIHEYQGKELFRKYGVAVPRGGVASTPEEAGRVAQELGGAVVVKAQIHAGGRGKGGGVKLAKGPAEARQAASQIIGMTLVTHQTGPQGRLVKKVWVEEASQIARELYLGIVLDRAIGRPTIMASTAGGMDIEEVAAKTPEKLLRVPVDPALGAWPSTARRVAYGLGLTGNLAGEGVKFVTNLYRFYSEMDCSLVEINPLVQTQDGRVLALDAKVNFDDNALYRHPEVEALRDLDEEDPLEVEASKHHLNYIKLDGAVGCMVNGAGLAMATMDIIKLAGASPANFLDVGGGASREMVESAFRILMSDKAVRAVLINIFGGILRCDVLAQGVVDAVKTVNVNVPIVIRMEGTNVEKGREILRASGLDFTVADGMGDAAKKVVAALSR